MAQSGIQAKPFIETELHQLEKHLPQVCRGIRPSFNPASPEASLCISTRSEAKGLHSLLLCSCALCRNQEQGAEVALSYLFDPHIPRLSGSYTALDISCSSHKYSLASVLASTPPMGRLPAQNSQRTAFSNHAPSLPTLTCPTPKAVLGIDTHRAVLAVQCRPGNPHLTRI